MDRRIVLAYDGTINADWVSRYAIQMAAILPSRLLILVHILDGTFSRAKIEGKFTTIAAECAKNGIACQHLIVEKNGDVYATLLRIIPSGERSYCLCGARIAPRGRGFLAGTISERLLRAGTFNVMAIRVVRPGLLGCPRTLLFPLAGHPRGFQAAMPFLQMLASSVKRVHLLRVMTVNAFHFRYISAPIAKEKVAEGYRYLGRVAADIREQTAGSHWHFDHHVVLSDDWAKEICIQAGKLNADMVLLGASGRGLSHRFFHGNQIERILSSTACDLGVYRKL